ncbi:hypothetical protein [Bradyrhizobium liaoningense]|uniref:hypothetical protein n=1 Tax=Bradyrhizobium liaoningense TaxID=43992 RepID=UPI001BAD9666|nr:hypothetical protein [Bradyrhizobium liaoningense]MBR0717249.1 hypothetical protein [Bradyrhizobium liaoningense]
MAEASAYRHDPDSKIVVAGATQGFGEAIACEFAELGLLARGRQGRRLPRQRRIRFDDRREP